jgi:hypothetical protein
MRSITNILKKLAGPTKSIPTDAQLTIRYARPADTDALAVLAQLDSSHPPRGATLVAEADGELWAAISIDDSHLIANPFRPSGELGFYLVGRAREIRRAERRQRRRSATRSWRLSMPRAG